MILSTETKEKIMNVRDYYDKKNQAFNINFTNEILEVLKQEEAFKDEFKYIFVEDTRYGLAFTVNGIACFNIPLFIHYIKNRTEQLFNSKKDMSKCYNFIALLIILHESSHVWQQKGLEEYPELNRLHKDLFTNNCENNLKNIFKIIMNYLRSNWYDCFERQANVDALRELVEMYQGYDFLDFIENRHINNLSIKPKGKSLAHDTLKKFLLKYNYDCTGIPEYLLFEVGMPTPKEYTENIYNAIDKYFDDELSYKEVIKRIRK